MLGGLLAAGVFDQDAVHGLGGRGEEVAPAIPVLLGPFTDQPQARLVDQGGLRGAQSSWIRRRDYFTAANGAPGRLGHRMAVSLPGGTVVVLELLSGEEVARFTAGPAGSRQVLNGEPAARIAEELGLSLNSVLLAKSRVLKRLRQELAGLVD
jgi:hypothetical protein